LQYLANAADLIISNSPNGTNVFGPAGYIPKGTNIFIFYQDAFNATKLKPLTPDFYILKTAATTGLYTNYVSPLTSAGKGSYTNVSYAGWSFVTNVAFWDFRENDIVQAVQIDVSKFNIWVTNQVATNGGGQYNIQCGGMDGLSGDKGHTIDSIWVNNNVTLTSATLPAVRIVNGIQLPNLWGLTVATPMPIYVYGDYNKQRDASHVSIGTNTIGTTFPAALMGDSVTILSSAWNDTAYNSGTALTARNAVSTTVNAACLEGIVQSSGANYSGGVENFLRYLEDWKSSPGPDTSTYNGSIVVMFPSIYATNFWQGPGGSGYYDVPTRQWGFDFNFVNQNNLPPLTPQLKKTVRVSWNAQ
jgi:hypothetical protein